MNGSFRGAAFLAAKGLAIGWGGRTDRLLASGIDLELKAGDFTALIGPNGSGKSTLLRTLVGLQAPLRGEAVLCGKDVMRLTVEERARRAACVFTDRFDSGYLTVFDIVAFGRYPYTDARNRLNSKDLAAVNGAIASVGLEKLSRRRFAELSDGERQKGLIAKAIAQDCPILVLDEPTAFLDAPTRVEIFHLSRDLAHTSGKAVVFSTHDLDQALRYADRIWLMDRTHKLVTGAPEDLALSGAIGRAFDGENFRFDASLGTFRSIEMGIPYTVELLGPEGSSLAWAERLVERLGLTPSRNERGEPLAIASVEIETGEAGPEFRIGGKRLSGYGELARFLTELVETRSKQPELGTFPAAEHPGRDGGGIGP